MNTLSDPDLRHHHFGHTLGKLDILGHVHFHELLRIECVGQSYGGYTYKDMWYRWPWYVFMLLRSSPFEEECSLCRTHEQVSLTQLRIRVRGLESDNLGCVSSIITFVRFVVIVNKKIHNSKRTLYHYTLSH